MSPSVSWIECPSWELDFFGLPHRIPWPADMDPAVATQEPFETEHLVRAIGLLGSEVDEPWRGFANAAAHFEELAEALEDGELARAGALLTEIERLHPGTSFVLFHQAYIARNEGRDEEAMALYRRAAEKTPGVVEIWNNLGVVLAFAGQRDQAIAAFRKSLEVQPNDRVALEGLAQLRVLVKLLRKADDPNSAVFADIPAFRRITTEQIPAMARDPDRLVAFGEQLLRDALVPDVGIAALEKARELRPQDARTLLSLGAAYRQIGQYAMAREIIAQHATGSGDATAFFHLAEVCKATGDVAGERAALEQSLAIDPNMQGALAGWFELGANEHDPQKEQQLAKFGEERGSWMAFVLASVIARARGDAKKAVSWAERAVELNPDGEEPILHHAVALGDARDVATLARVIKPKVESGNFSKRLDWTYAHVLRHLGLHNDAVAVLRNASSGQVPEDFKTSCLTTVEAWTGLLTGAGVALELHRSGVLLRPVTLALEEGGGGVILNAGSTLPAEGAFVWRVTDAETEVPLQQGHSDSEREAHNLGIFKVRGIQPAAAPTGTIECHVAALPGGVLHFRAAQNGRRLHVGWAPSRAKMR